MACTFIICGPKCSICCTLVSVWGVIMLAIMGVLLQKRSLTFAEDLLDDIHAESLEEFRKEAEDKYDNAAITCYIAAGIYLGTFALSLWQAFLNKRHNRI